MRVGEEEIEEEDDKARVAGRMASRKGSAMATPVPRRKARRSIWRDL